MEGPKYQYKGNTKSEGPSIKESPEDEGAKGPKQRKHQIRGGAMAPASPSLVPPLVRDALIGACPIYIYIYSHHLS